jgi:hypothetical protein
LLGVHVGSVAARIATREKGKAEDAGTASRMMKLELERRGF